MTSEARDIVERLLHEATMAPDYAEKVFNEAAEEIRKLREALREAERFMAYFAGETNYTFVGPGTPTECLAQIRQALSPTGD